MKHFRTIIIAVIILALISASAMAISKSDLISSFKSQSGSSLSKPMISPTPTDPIPSTPSEVSPFPSWAIPTPIPSSGKSYFPSWFSPSSGKPIVSPTPTLNPSRTGDSSAYIRCPPGIPVGPLTRTWCTCMSYINATTGEVFDDDCRDSEGNPYPIGVDRLGKYYLVKPGCPCTWAE
jgi:hypothetical protein